jgi:hypothetical protein
LVKDEQGLISLLIAFSGDNLPDDRKPETARVL